MKKLRKLKRIVTWKKLLAAVGLFGLLYMLFFPDSRDPSLIIVFFTMLGIGPLAAADEYVVDRDDPNELEEDGQRRFSKRKGKKND